MKLCSPLFWSWRRDEIFYERSCNRIKPFHYRYNLAVGMEWKTRINPPSRQLHPLSDSIDKNFFLYIYINLFIKSKSNNFRRIPRNFAISFPGKIQQKNKFKRAKISTRRSRWKIFSFKQNDIDRPDYTIHIYPSSLSYPWSLFRHSLWFLNPPSSCSSAVGAVAKGETATNLLRGARRNSCGECNVHVHTESRSFY